MISLKLVFRIYCNYVFVIYFSDINGVAVCFKTGAVGQELVTTAPLLGYR